MDQRPATLSAAAMSTAFGEGTLSPVDVIEDVLALIDRLEPGLNAFSLRQDAQECRRQAAASARRWAAASPLGPLDGVPVTLKENIPRAGVPTSSGCAGAPEIVPERDAPVTERVTAAGMVVLGSTTMPDWGMLSSGHSSRHGLTRSPLDPARTTGGSSSGAGAAAAAGYGPLHVGTDIGGSIRLPGTWLGLATLKPSAGRVPLHAPYLGRVAGPMARSAEDCALLLRVLAGPHPLDWTSLPGPAPNAPDEEPGTVDPWPRGRRVAVWTRAGYGVEAEPEVLAVVLATAERLAAAGAEIVEIDPWARPEMLDRIDLFWQARSWAELSRLPAAAQGRVLPYVAEWASRAAGVSGTDVMDAYHGFAALQAATVAAWQRAGDPDLLLSPVAPCAAAPAELPMPYPEQGMGHINFTVPWNMTGAPAGTVDAGRMPDGRTVGVQLVGRARDDAGVLRAMRWLT
jgi:aspartyl-tRNA(Asn)/glutamyl-tRNA(Gln) amidotransferase subunit A